MECRVIPGHPFFVENQNTRNNIKRDQEMRKTQNINKRKGVIFPVASSKSEMPDSYADFLKNLKERIQQERIKAVLSANSAMLILYWDIGNTILEKQKIGGWDAKVIDRLSHDLKEAFPDMKGFSPRNLK